MHRHSCRDQGDSQLISACGFGASRWGLWAYLHQWLLTAYLIQYYHSEGKFCWFLALFWVSKHLLKLKVYKITCLWLPLLIYMSCELKSWRAWAQLTILYFSRIYYFWELTMLKSTLKNSFFSQLWTRNTSYRWCTYFLFFSSDLVHTSLNSSQLASR